jgi:hypothetical protein
MKFWLLLVPLLLVWLLGTLFALAALLFDGAERISFAAFNRMYAVANKTGGPK